MNSWRSLRHPASVLRSRAAYDARSPPVGTLNFYASLSRLITYTDALDEGVTALLVASPPILAMRPSIKGITAYGPKNKLLVHVKSGIGVDIFSTDAENWGMALLIRTGSREFNIRVMARLKQLGMSGHAYPKPGQGAITSSSGADIFCPDEDIVFRNLGWAYLPPEKRQ